jgi:hypothetical protein
MLGTCGGALEAGRLDASNGKLMGDVTGQEETDEAVLVIKRIQLAIGW